MAKRKANPLYPNVGSKNCPRCGTLSRAIGIAQWLCPKCRHGFNDPHYNSPATDVGDDAEESDGE